MALPRLVRAEELPAPDGWLQWHLGPFYTYGQCKADDPALELEMRRAMQRLEMAYSRVMPPLPSHTFVEPRAQAGQQAGCRSVPMSGIASTTQWAASQVELPPDGIGHGKRRRDSGEAMAAVGLAVNEFPALTAVDFSPGDAPNNPDTFVRYHPTGFLQGYPIFDYVHVVVTAAGHAPLFLPVTIDQALTRAIAVHEKEYLEVLRSAKEDEARVDDSSELIRSLKSSGAGPDQIREFKDSMHRTVRERVVREKAILDLLNQRRAALTPQTRTLQAHVKLVNDRLVPQTEAEPDADPLVRANPAYFDPALGRVQAQLLVVHLYQAYGDPNRPLDKPADWWARAVRDVDWRAFARENLR
jgi:hypothetical protein